MSDYVKQVKWGFASDEEPEGWEGSFNSREEAIAAGRETYGDEEFWICSGEPADPVEFLQGIVGTVVDYMQTEAEALFADVEDYPSLSEEAEAELGNLLVAWARKHAVPDFWAGDKASAEHVPGKEEVNP